MSKNVLDYPSNDKRMKMYYDEFSLLALRHYIISQDASDREMEGDWKGKDYIFVKRMIEHKKWHVLNIGCGHIL